MNEKTDSPLDASSSLPWPPIIFATAFALSVLGSWLHPALIAPPDNHREWIRLAGIALTLFGGGLAIAAERSFLKAGTATLPTRPTRLIVPTGPYRFSRNPMYLGMSFVLAGVGFLANSWWFLAALPFAVLTVTKLAIEREEAYLERKFGSQYLDYKARTRRWL